MLMIGDVCGSGAVMGLGAKLLSVEARFHLLGDTAEERGLPLVTLFEADLTPEGRLGMMGLLLPLEALEVRRLEEDLARFDGL